MARQSESSTEARRTTRRPVCGLRTATAGVAAVVITALAIAPGPSMSAAAGPASLDAQAAATQSCKDEAISRQLEAWLCFGNQLNYTNGDGSAATPEWQREMVGGVGHSSDMALVNSSEPTNFDQYCEYGVAICTDYKDKFRSWTKGNAAYGTRNEGQIGSFDITLRTSLYGRSMRWHVELHHDLGPSLKFERMYINCREDNNGWTDSNCGVAAADNDDGAMNVGVDKSWKGPEVRGAYLKDNNDYYAQVDGYFTPAGHSQFVMKTLRSAQVDCYNDEPCFFDDAD